MTTTKIIDPINRIEGDLAVELTIKDNLVKDARCRGFVYRGLEKIFIGREPEDAVRLSQRSCGVCSVPHGEAGVSALESIAGAAIPRNAELIRDLTLGAEMVVNHMTHFYFMWGPDLVNPVYSKHWLYPEVFKRFEPMKSMHLRAILKNVRVPLHSVVAVFGGRIPQPSHCVPGGISCFPKQVEVNKVISMIFSVRDFVEKEILNGLPIDDFVHLSSSDELFSLMEDEAFSKSDVGIFLKYGKENCFYELGCGAPLNFLSYGFGRLGDGKWLLKPGYLQGGEFHELDLEKISEDTTYAYYETEKDWRKPSEGRTSPMPRKEDGYSWIKAPRYFGNVCELGTLPRMVVQGDPLIKDMVRVFGVNTYTRMFARLYESLLVLRQLRRWAEEIDLDEPFYYSFPERYSGSGVGTTEAPRGGLGHWVSIEDGKVKNYQIVTPSTWNCSPRDSKGQKGPLESALSGLRLRDESSILEAGHVVRAFDPCISCSIHAIGRRKTGIVPVV